MAWECLVECDTHASMGAPWPAPVQPSQPVPRVCSFCNGLSSTTWTGDSNEQKTAQQFVYVTALIESRSTDDQRGVDLEPVRAKRRVLEILTEAIQIPFPTHVGEIRHHVADNLSVRSSKND